MDAYSMLRAWKTFILDISKPVDSYDKPTDDIEQTQPIKILLLEILIEVN